MAIFNTNAETISLRFICPYCGQEETTYSFDVPVPNSEADNVEESENSSEETYTCTVCERTFTIDIYNNMYEGNVFITDEDGNEIEITEVTETFSEN